MKKLITVFLLLASFLYASPAFAYPIKQGYPLSDSLKDYKQDLEVFHSHHDGHNRVSVRETDATTKPSQTNSKSKYVKISLTDTEIDLLSRLVRAEAETEPFEGKVAVACVVLNRVESKKFPDTIREVIYARGQFQPVQNGEINKPANEESIKAVRAALTEQRNLAPGALFFYNPDIATSRWLDTRTTTMVIGQHVFKK
ncbi:cell wall hydrolase [Neobacillus drentensis]|uniref:cell wall hydrolase n=1 Tax=Neobacillus drentensis TaxID=220684 RepID=UPI00285DE149|nr:cell wall hydrolase [Neobacillus drentensis]MDR7235849.1 N-acetylmuramoyl-L-alanine amidase [Neobacillus drentensis]